MATFYNEPSRTFSEYLLIPNLTTKECIPENVSLRTPIVKYNKGEEAPISINLPFVSAIMQAVSDHNMAIALARTGGLSFIYGSQPIEKQAEMVHKVKAFKAGFVESDSNLRPDHSLSDVLALIDETGHSTIPITDDGTKNGKLLGILTDKDYRVGKTSLTTKVKDIMIPFGEKLVYGEDGLTLSQANDMIYENKISCLPIVTKDQHLKYLVFRKDYDQHQQYPNEVLDVEKKLMVGAGINTKDYAERVPALVKAGADILCIDSSDGYSEWQKDTLTSIKKEFGDDVKIGAGNVVDKEGFLYLVKAGADFIKVGIGGGSICITREQKGIGRGQASALIEVSKARDDYFKQTGVYIPICTDGGIVHEYHITLALAMGADFVMMGRYFARFDESPAPKLRIGANYVKEYWGEGSNRAKNWQRYSMKKNTGREKLEFEEGVDSYVPYAGMLKENVDVTVNKIKSTMCNCGALSIKELQEKARLTVVSSTSIIEGGAHDVVLKDKNGYNNYS